MQVNGAGILCDDYPHGIFIEYNFSLRQEADDGIIPHTVFVIKISYTPAASTVVHTLTIYVIIIIIIVCIYIYKTTVMRDFRVDWPYIFNTQTYHIVVG